MPSCLETAPVMTCTVFSVRHTGQVTSRMSLSGSDVPGVMQDGEGK